MFWESIRNLIYVTRSYMTVLSGFTVLIGAYLAGASLLTAAPYWLALAQVLVVAAVFQWNEITDSQHDKLSQVYKPVAQDDLSPKLVRGFVIAEVLIAIVIGFFISIPAGVIIVCQVVLSACYSRLKRFNGLAGNCLTAILFATVLCLGGVLGNNYTLCILCSVVATLFIIGREIIKDILDIEADALGQRPTIPVLYGEIYARNLGNAFMLVSLAALIGITYWNLTPLSLALTLVTGLLLIWTIMLLNRSMTAPVLLNALRISALCLAFGLFSFVGLR